MFILILKVLYQKFWILIILYRADISRTVENNNIIGVLEFFCPYFLIAFFDLSTFEILRIWLFFAHYYNIYKINRLSKL